MSILESQKQRLAIGLKKSCASFLDKFNTLFRESFNLNDSLYEELEDILLASDIGVAATDNLLHRLRTRFEKGTITDAQSVITALRNEALLMLQGAQKRTLLKRINQQNQIFKRPFVMMVVGVNGVGKTTTIAKIANRLKNDGKTVLLAAADTFRAAAIEQLEYWGQRIDIPVVAHKTGSDPAAVVHDALAQAIAKKTNVLLIDTAGRLHTQINLIHELEKITRVIRKLESSAPHEVMLVVDASIGQNTLSQVEHFHKTLTINSLSVTKLDGSARGGVLLALTQRFQLPIRFIAVGESCEDLLPFDADAFVQTLIPGWNND